MGLPAVVTHERHRGGNSTPLDIPVDDRSGPVTEIPGRVGVAVHQPSTGGATPHPLTELEVGQITAAGVPAQCAFATKPELARVMLQRVLDAGVPAGWVTADAVDGNSPALRGWLEGRQLP